MNSNSPFWHLLDPSFYLCSTLPNGVNILHFNNQDKANCLNDYFASISTVNDSETHLPPFSKITDNSLSQINCTELEIANIIEVLNSNKASGDDGISHKMLKGVSKLFQNPSELAGPTMAQLEVFFSSDHL